jgi:hypothetical protein
MLARNSDLWAAGGLEQPALVRDLPEEPCVLDREGRLGGERHEHAHHLGREVAGRLAEDGQDTDDLLLPEQRHAQEGAVARLEERRPHGTFVDARHRDVGDVDRLAQ